MLGLNLVNVFDLLQRLEDTEPLYPSLSNISISFTIRKSPPTTVIDFSTSYESVI